MMIADRWHDFLVATSPEYAAERAAREFIRHRTLRIPPYANVYLPFYAKAIDKRPLALTSKGVQ